jgi:hypothetical protein
MKKFIREIKAFWGRQGKRGSFTGAGNAATGLDFELLHQFTQREDVTGDPGLHAQAEPAGNPQAFAGGF